jgi:Holliday junction resolvase RusA-like endonuclease
LSLVSDGRRIVVYGDAKPAGSKRAFVRGNRAMVVDANPNAGTWKKQVAQAAGEQWAGGLLDGPLAVTFSFFRPRPKSHFTGKGELRAAAPEYPATRPDTTKLVRGVEDALTGIVWRDDAQIVYQLATKHYDEPARCVVTVAQA